MPRKSEVTLTVACEVLSRRAAGEPWKTILADLRARGLPAGRTRWTLAVQDAAPFCVHEHTRDGRSAA